MITTKKEQREAVRRLSQLKRNPDKNWQRIQLLEMRLDEMKYA